MVMIIIIITKIDCSCDAQNSNTIINLQMTNTMCEKKNGKIEYKIRRYTHACDRVLKFHDPIAKTGNSSIGYHRITTGSRGRAAKSVTAERIYARECECACANKSTCFFFSYKVIPQKPAYCFPLPFNSVRLVRSIRILISGIFQEDIPAHVL